MISRPPHWVADAVFYQVFPDRFAISRRVPKPGALEAWEAPPTVHGFKGGDLLGIVDQLDQLAELGVTALLLTPVFASAANHRYHTVDYLAVDPLLGGDAALRELLDAAHARGLRVVLDGVFNHTGRGFWPFVHLLEAGAASPYRDWYHLSDAVRRGQRAITAYPDAEALADLGRRRPGERLGDASERVLGYRSWWDLPELPKLNHAHPAVRDYLMRVAEHWIRFGVDGWRLDVAEEIDDPAFWAEFRQRVRAVNPEAYLVGEIWRTRPEWVGDDRFDALTNYPLAEAIIGFAAGERLDRGVFATHGELADQLQPLDGEGFGARLGELLGAYPAPFGGAQLNLLGSHDMPRLRTICGGDEAAVRLAVLALVTLPGAPSIYYGDELGLEGGADPACRAAYPADPARRDVPLRGFVRRAIRTRADHPALRGGDWGLLATAGSALAYCRDGATGTLVVALNAGSAAAHLEVELGQAIGEALHPLLATNDDPLPGPVPLADGRARLRLPPRSGLVLRRG